MSETIKAEPVALKKTLWASVHTPLYPRVRFFLKVPDPAPTFQDITDRVAKLIVEESQDGSEFCNLLRLDANDNLVWKTRHMTLQELKWHVEFEYGLPGEKWLTYPPV